MARDIAILGPPASLRPALLDFDGTVSEGLYTLVQRVLIVLFTDKNNPYSFGIGTDIPQLLSGANAVQTEILQQEFNIASADIQDIFDAEDITGVPDDEVLQDVSFTVIQPDEQLPDTRTIEVYVLSQAGTEATVETPIKFEVSYG